VLIVAWLAHIPYFILQAWDKATALLFCKLNAAFGPTD
jgi:hypothetical protein